MIHAPNGSGRFVTEADMMTEAMNIELADAHLELSDAILHHSKHHNLSDEEESYNLARADEACSWTKEQITKGWVAPTDVKRILHLNYSDVILYHKTLKSFDDMDRAKAREAERRKYGRLFRRAAKKLCAGLNKTLDDDRFVPLLGELVEDVNDLRQQGGHREILEIISALEGVACRAQHYADVLGQRPKLDHISNEGVSNIAMI